MTEGPTSDPRFRGPIHHYPVASIAGGAFCPSGDAAGFPRPYRGKYFFMDFVRGWIKVLDPDHPKRVETFAAGLTRPVDLAFSPDGALYVLLRDAWVVDGNFRPGTGSLLRIRASQAAASRRRIAIVRVSEVTIHGDMDCFQVETPTATYIYGKRGAGFASIIDKDGRDWVSYRPGDKARGEYRGLPKCGQPTKFFHCGYGYGQYQTDNPFSSRVTVREAGHARIESETRDGKSACLWDFYPDHATLTLLRIDLPTFWFLYEGTPGGKLDAERDFVIRPDGQKTTLDHALVAGGPLGLLRVGRDARRVRLRQSPGSGARRGRLLRLLAVRKDRRRFVSGHDGLRLRSQGTREAGRARRRSQAAARAIQHCLHRSSRPRHRQGDLRAAPSGGGRRCESVDPRS